MKKKGVLAGIMLIIICLISGLIYGYSQWKRARNEKIEQTLLLIEYRRQNAAFGMSVKATETGYHGYEEIREEDLFIRLAAYENWCRQQEQERPELTIADVTEYFSSEYNLDGSLRVTNRPENIQRYMDWYSEGGDGEIEKYWDDLQTIALNYEREHSETELKTVKNMTTEKLQELINKYNDPAYEINPEIMGATQ